MSAMQTPEAQAAARDLLQGWWAKNGGAEVRCLPAGCWKLDSPRHAMYRRAPC